MGKRVAHPVHPAALLGCGKYLAGRGAQPFVIVGDDQLHTSQAAIRQRAQEGFPEGFGFRRAGGYAQNLAPAIGVDAHRDYRRRRDNPSALAHFEVGGVDP